MTEPNFTREARELLEYIKGRCVTDTILTDLASLPSIKSLKHAQTIIDEMQARGWVFVPRPIAEMCEIAAARVFNEGIKLKTLSTPSHDQTRAPYTNNEA